MWRRHLKIKELSLSPCPHVLLMPTSIRRQSYSHNRWHEPVGTSSEQQLGGLFVCLSCINSALPALIICITLPPASGAAASPRLGLHVETQWNSQHKPHQLHGSVLGVRWMSWDSQDTASGFIRTSNPAWKWAGRFPGGTVYQIFFFFLWIDATICRKCTYYFEKCTIFCSRAHFSVWNNFSFKN